MFGGACENGGTLQIGGGVPKKRSAPNLKSAPKNDIFRRDVVVWTRKQEKMRASYENSLRIPLFDKQLS